MSVRKRELQDLRDIFEIDEAAAHLLEQPSIFHCFRAGQPRAHIQRIGGQL